MSIDWNALPGLPTRVATGVVPDHFGDLAGELAAVSAASGNAVAAVAVTDLAWVRCSGSDAQSFLHNQVTSDVNHLAVGHWQHSAWCTAKGRMLANFVLARADGGEGYLLGMPQELVPGIVKRLRMFVLRSQVVIDDLSDSVATVAFCGSGIESLAAALGTNELPASNGVARADGCWIVRLSDRVAVVAIEAEKLPSLAPVMQVARPVGFAAWKLVEVQSGVPVIRLATQEEFVPQMVNFDKIGGVSFHKGCYPGQEIVARTQYLGKVKRHLYRVSADQAIEAGQALFAPGSGDESAQSCGTVANAAPGPNGGWTALAVILESAADAPLHAGSPAGPLLSNIDLVAA